MTRRTLLLLSLLLLPLGLLHAEEEAAAVPSGPTYLPIGEKFVVNVQGSAKPRFMQLKVQAMTREAKVAEAVDANMPALTHAMIMLLSQQDADTMSSIQGREAVRAQALVELQKVLSELAGLDQGLAAVYFTDFVLQ